MDFNRIVIIGTGAVGGSIAGMLVRSGVNVACVARGEHGKHIRDQGLTVNRPQESFSVRLSCFPCVSQVDWQSDDVAILATKLNDAESSIADLAKFAPVSLPLVCATNGIHAEKWAAAKFRNVVSMMIWMPTTFLTPGEVSIYGDDCPGVLDCGALNQRPTADSASRYLCHRLVGAGFDSIHRSPISPWKHAKWITNLANTAQALVVDDWKAVARAAQEEGKRVIDHSDLERVSGSELRERTKSVNLLPIDGKDRPGGSTWQSLHRNKPLESPWLEGAIAELGLKVGIPTPVNALLATAGAKKQTLHAAEILANG